MLAVVIALSTLWNVHLHEWYAHDEGTLMGAAIRVGAGLVPHRDFGHPYTGMDPLLHLIFMQIFGESMAGIRTGFAFIASAWLVGTVAWIASRQGLAIASGAALVLGGWAFAVYPAAMPSWYVGMLVAASLAVLMGGTAIPSRSRLLSAGTLLGLALGFKVTASYAIAGVALWLMLERTPSDRKCRVSVLAMVSVGTAALVVLLGHQFNARNGVHLLLPPALVLAAVLFSEVSAARKGVTLFGTEVGQLSTLGFGVAVGGAPMAIWMIVTGAAAPFIASVTGVAGLRGEFASIPMPPVSSILLAGLALGAVAALSRLRDRAWISTALIMVGLFALAWVSARWHRGVWLTVRGLVPLGVGLILLGRSRGWRTVGSGATLVVCVLGWMVLTQFPFGAPVYFSYLVPMLVMITGSLLFTTADSRRFTTVLLFGIGLFGILQVVPGSLAAMGQSRARGDRLAYLTSTRGHLMVPETDSASFARIVSVIDSISPASTPIWAGPDSPEIAVLAKREELNLAPFGFLSGQTGPDLKQLPRDVVVVIHRDPAFSPPLSDSLVAQIEAVLPSRHDFPRFIVFGRM
ncbi:MAG TPA: hypothetical protein VFN22_01545 [Gemmatimonadales bacterium]|nr:hypothetical protein [Gemmatimonadales bacterium]